MTKQSMKYCAVYYKVPSHTVKFFLWIRDSTEQFQLTGYLVLLESMQTFSE